MPRKNIILTPSTLKKLEKMGAQIKKARLRRNIGAELIAERAGISEATFYVIEKGKPTVSVGAYAAVLAVLELDEDLELIALDEEGEILYIYTLYEPLGIGRKVVSCGI